MYNDIDDGKKTKTGIILSINVLFLTNVIATNFVNVIILV